MANTILITANWHTGALSQQTISRQYDNNRYVVQFVGYPEASEGNELDYYLLVWMSSAPGEKPDEIAPIQLASDQWYISNVFTQQTQQIKFQMCALNTEGTFEAHSPIFTGFVRNSLDHDGTTQDIDVSTLFDAYREYLNELIIGAGAVIIDPVPTQGSNNAVRSGGVWNNAFIAERQILQSGDDANNLTLAGSYVKPAANNVSNLPVQNSGILIVITRGTVVYQLYLSGAPNGGKLFYRKVGGDWKTIATTADTGAITDSIDALGVSIDSNFFKAFREAMADGADANDKTVVGAYAKPASRTISNIPTQNVGYLCVLTNGSDARQLYVTHNNIYHRTNGRDWHMLTESRLFGKTLIALGDSLIYGQGLSADDRAKYTWTARLASDYGMTTYNYGVSGSSIAKLENGSGGEDAPLSMATRIDGIVTTHASDTVDYFILEGGANDFNNTQNMGNLDRGNLDKTTFYGALNYIVNQVHATWPKARLLLMTNYDRKIRGTTAKNDETYVDAMVAFAKYRSIPVFDNYHTIGVSIKDYANPTYDPSTDPAEDKYLDNWFFPKSLGQHLSIDAYEWVTPIYAQTLERI